MAHDVDGDGNLDSKEFDQMLEKIIDGETLMNDLLLHRQMYSAMSM